MRRFQSVVILFAATFGVPSVLAAQTQCDTPVARYDVRYAGNDLFDVTAQFAEPSKQWDLAHFPTPDRPEAQSASVRSLKVSSADGQEIPVSYVGDGTFKTDGGRGATSLQYQLLADHDLADWNAAGGPGKDEVATKFDRSFVFAGHAFFLLDYDMKRCPVEVYFDLPDGWKVTTPWRKVGDHYVIDDSWGLGQNMFAMGQDSAQVVEVGGLTLTWLMDSKLDPVRDEVREILSVLPDRYSSLWGETPGSNFSVFFMASDMSDGGAFWNSFALRYAVPLSEADKVSWRHTLGHEVMHLWNKLGKKNGENVPELEWVNEGFTDYLTVKGMAQAGLLPPEMVEQRVANIIRRYVLAGRLTPDVTLRSAGAEKSANWNAVYGGGAMVALMLDAELSRDDPEAFGRVLRMMRAEQGEGYDYDRFVETLNRETDGRAGEIIAWIDSRPSGGDIVKRFRALGLDVSIFGYDEAYVRFKECDTDRCPPGFLAVQS